MPRRSELCAVEWNQWKGEKQQRDVFLCTLDAILAWLVAIYKKAKQRIVGKKKWKSGIEWKHERPMTTTTQNSFLSFYVFFRMHKIFCLWDRGTGVGEIFCKLKIICIVAIAFCNSIFTLNSLSSQNIRDCSGKRKRKHIHDKREKFYIFALLERNGNRNDRLFRSLFSMVVARFFNAHVIIQLCRRCVLHTLTHEKTHSILHFHKFRLQFYFVISLSECRRRPCIRRRFDFTSWIIFKRKTERKKNIQKTFKSLHFRFEIAILFCRFKFIV